MAAQSQNIGGTGAIRVNRPVQWVARFIALLLLVWAVYASPPLKSWPIWLSAAGWIGFSIYWSRKSRDAAAARSSESAKSRHVHEVLTNVSLLLLFIPAPGLREPVLPASPAWVPLGLAVQAASIALAVWARRHLGTNWSGRIEIKTDHELVRTGPYRVLRHPIYTAVFGMYPLIAPCELARFMRGENAFCPLPAALDEALRFRV